MTFKNFDVIVLNGLPITIKVEIGDVDESVGISSPTVDSWQITSVAGRRLRKSPEWLYNKIFEKGEESVMLRQVFSKIS